MATRGAIARLTGIHPIRFGGVYHHWDSYPEGLGKTLWELYHTVFGKDLEALLKAVVDDHPAGWSSLHASDFNVADDGMQKTDGGSGETAVSLDLNCYCHGDRNEDPWEVNERNAAGSGIEYVYAFSRNGLNGESRIASVEQPLAEQHLAEQPTLFVLSSYRANGDKMIGMFGCGDPDAKWRVIAQVDLDGEEPDWQGVADGFVAPPLQ